MDDDLQAIKDWATTFTHPGTLAKELSKNWLLHHKKVKTDIAQEEADWSNGKYFDAGVDTALAVDLLIPFQKSLTYDLNTKGAVEFLGGFLQGFVGDNHMDEIQACGVDAEKEGKSVEQALADLKGGHKV